MKKLIEKIRLFRQERDWDQYHSPKNLAMALMVEVGELAEHFQWMTQKESHNLPPEKLDKIKDEIGDIMIYLANLADKLNIDPVVAAHDKVEKNRSKYPADKAKGSAKKYTELD